MLASPRLLPYAGDSFSREQKGLYNGSNITQMDEISRIVSLVNTWLGTTKRMRSSRTLFFTNEGVFWQCNELLNSEYGPISTQDLYRVPTTRQICTSIVSRKDDFPLDDPWVQLLSRYMEKQFTKPTDRLPAITGLGVDIAKACGVEFHMGVLSHTLIVQLAWYMQDADWSVEKPLARQPGIPSWSWASPNHKILFLGSLKYGVEVDIATGIELVLDGHQLKARACFQSLRVKRKSTWRAGSHGCGPQHLSHRGYEFIPTKCHAGLPTSHATASSRSAILRFDTLLGALSEEGEDILCIQWYKQLGAVSLDVLPWATSKEISNMAMVVSPVDGSESMFSRRGWLVIGGDDLFQDEPQNVTLV